jgi:hypothetical protein
MDVKCRILAENTAILTQKLILTLVFKKTAIFFLRKLVKIAENCDHNIDS